MAKICWATKSSPKKLYRTKSQNHWTLLRAANSKIKGCNPGKEEMNYNQESPLHQDSALAHSSHNTMAPLEAKGFEPLKHPP